MVDTDAPSSLTFGQTVPLQVSSAMDIPAEVVTALGDGVAWVAGTAALTVSVDGVARQTSLTIPKTFVPDTDNPPVLSGAGPGGSITPGPTLPTIVLGAGAFTLTLTGFDDLEEPVGEPVAIPCTLRAGRPRTSTPSACSRHLPRRRSRCSRRRSPTAPRRPLTAEVAQTGSSVKPGGTVAFSLDGTTVSAPVQGGKAKVDLPPAFAIGVRTVTATFTPDVKNLASSQASAFLTVVRDSTKTVARAVYRDARQRLVGKARVVATHEAAVAGAVRLVLKRDGVRIRVAKVGLNQFGKAKKAFKNVTKPGRYTVVTRYLGSPTFKRSADRAGVTL